MLIGASSSESVLAIGRWIASAADDRPADSSASTSCSCRSAFQPHSRSLSRTKTAVLKSAGVPATCGSEVKTLSHFRAFSGVGKFSAYASALSWSVRDRGMNTDGEAAVNVVGPLRLGGVGSDA